MINKEDLDRLEEIRQDMLDLVDEARHIIRDTDESDRADAYCLAQLEMALTNDYEYLGGATFSLEDIIKNLEDSLEENESEETENA
jgi:hypothetical protein